jgi:imidazole glycerol-phosphate synthase subunit HisF
MLRSRVIPVLLMKDKSLVKTIKFKKYNYIGDPVNTACIFNELEVDELMILDIRASVFNEEPKFKILKEIAEECFMPLSYGGGIKSMDHAKYIFKVGFEKIVINSETFANPKLVRNMCKEFGSQAIIGSMDIKRNIFGKYKVFTYSGTKKTNFNPVEYAEYLTELGFGEILLTNINNEGTWKGFDINIIREVSDHVSIPVIAHGGAGSQYDIISAINNGHASAVALGNLVTYQKKNMGVLINFNESFKKINKI